LGRAELCSPVRRLPVAIILQDFGGHVLRGACRQVSGGRARGGPRAHACAQHCAPPMPSLVPALALHCAAAEGGSPPHRVWVLLPGRTVFTNPKSAICRAGEGAAAATALRGVAIEVRGTSWSHGGAGGRQSWGWWHPFCGAGDRKLALAAGLGAGAHLDVTVCANQKVLRFQVPAGGWAAGAQVGGHVLGRVGWRAGTGADRQAACSLF